MAGLCGTCTACCREFALPAIPGVMDAKPAGEWCRHCAIGKGCKIYDRRPDFCIQFECLWLYSQHEPSPMAPELRPDKCRVMFSPTTNPRFVSATTMKGSSNAWKKPKVMEVINFIVNQGANVAVGPAGATTVTLVSKDGIKEVEMTPPDEDGMQWNKRTVRYKV